MQYITLHELSNKDIWGQGPQHWTTRFLCLILNAKQAQEIGFLEW